MAYPASQQTLADGLKQAADRANGAKREVQELRDRSAAGDTDRWDYIKLMRLLANCIATWNEVSALPGIVSYATEQYDNLGLNIATEFTAMTAAAVTLRDWLFANVPTHASGAQIYRVYNADGTTTELTFTTAQTAQFRTEADAFIATVG